MSGTSKQVQRKVGWERQVSAELGSVVLDTLGLPAAIEWHVSRFRKGTGVLYELTVSDAAGFDLPEDCAATIFDIYAEALGNVARHAGASRVAIALAMSPHEVTMVVRDTGVGAGEEGADAGTTVTVSVPIARAA